MSFRQLVLNKNAVLAFPSLLCLLCLAAPARADAVVTLAAIGPGGTDSFSQRAPVSLSASVGVSGPGYGASATGFSNLASASIGFAATSFGSPSSGALVFSIADVRLSDVLTFTGASPFSVVFVFHGSGVITDDSSVQANLNVNGFDLAIRNYHGPGSFNESLPQTLQFGAGVSSTSIFLAASTFGPVENGSVNFLNTFSVQIILPPGVTFTSESGVFGTQSPGAPVPEPATMLLLGTGLVGVAAKVGRRRRARVE